MGKDDDLHVVMIPWLAFGHLVPFLELSIALAKSGTVKISFLSTPRNIQRLLPRIPKDLPPNLINLVGFPLPAPALESESENDIPLPADAEATVDLPSDDHRALKAAFHLLQQPINQFVAEQSPDWLIVDFNPDWTVEIAERYNVKLCYFSVVNACCHVFFGPPPRDDDKGKQRRRSPESLTRVPEWVPFESPLALTNHEAKQAAAEYFAEGGVGRTEGERVGRIVKSCDFVAIRSCLEFEGEAKYLNLYTQWMKKPVISVGLLPPQISVAEQKDEDTRSPKEAVKTFGENWDQIFNWLDRQEPRSVVFVGFGSESKLTKDQFFEIGYGLELCGLPFLWSVRKPIWAVDEGDFLPPGFVDRTKGRGVTTLEWVPQMEVLGHPSVGGSLFHSGWGSVIETLQFGHALVLLPLVFDQPMNARLLVEEGLGLEVKRGGDDGTFSRDGVAKALNTVMVEEEGQHFRVKAREAATVVGDRKLHQQYISDFLKYLKDKR